MRLRDDRRRNDDHLLLALALAPALLLAVTLAPALALSPAWRLER